MDHLWNCILGFDTDTNRDQKALAKICLYVDSSCIQHVRDAKTAKQAWDNLEKIFEYKGLFQRVSLLRKLDRADFKGYNSMTEHIDGIASLVQQLASKKH